MRSVSIRELRNNGAEVLSGVEGGAAVQVTRDGRPVATLSPLPRAPLSAEELLRRARALPRIDGDRFRADVDRLIDQQW